MTLTTENILLLGSVLLFVSILASKTSFKLGLPSLILFLVVGMLAGSDGPGGIYFNDPKSAQFLGIIALTFILFSGGMDTQWESIRPALRTGLSLSTLGVVISTVLLGWFAVLLFHVDWKVGMLLGAIVSSTDAAAVFSILRARGVGLKGHLRPILEFESGSNDPMSYFLTLSFIEIIQSPEASLWMLLPKFLVSMVLGAVCGYGFGRMMVLLVNRISLDIEGLYPVLMMALMFFAFSFTDRVGGNGFLAVYLSGIILGNSNFIHKKSLMRFYDGVAWLMQIVMFLALGLLVFPGKLVAIAGPALLLSLFLMLVARPVSVFISTFFSTDLNLRKKLFVSWVGLRGASSIVFATYPLMAGIAYAEIIFNLVFFISVTSVLLQGTTLPRMAKWLRVSVPEKVRRKFPLDIAFRDDLKSELVELDIPVNSQVSGKTLVELKLPEAALIVVIHRDGRYITPRGDTTLRDWDHLLIMTDSRETANKVFEKFGVIRTA